MLNKSITTFMCLKLHWTWNWTTSTLWTTIKYIRL